MGRVPEHKELENTRLANGYGGWIYCGGCGKTIGYLCYVTYHKVRFDYQCQCGNHGLVNIAFGEGEGKKSDHELTLIKNRLCCGEDESPLITVIEKNLDSFNLEIVCATCNNRYCKSK